MVSLTKQATSPVKSDSWHPRVELQGTFTREVRRNKVNAFIPKAEFFGVALIRIAR